MKIVRNRFDAMNDQYYFDVNRIYGQDLLIDHVEMLLNLTKRFHSIAMYDHPRIVKHVISIVYFI